MTWYTKSDRKSNETTGMTEKEIALKRREEEMKAIQEEEKQQMLEKLGLVPKRAIVSDVLSTEEMKKVLERKGDISQANGGSGNRVQGLGFAPAAQHYVSDELRKKMDIEKLEGIANQNVSKLKGISSAANVAAFCATSATATLANEIKSVLTEEELKILLKHHKREEKERKKAAKKDKKAEKAKQSSKDAEKDLSKKHHRSFPSDEDTRKRPLVSERGRNRSLSPHERTRIRSRSPMDRKKSRSRTPNHRRRRSRSVDDRGVLRRYRSRSPLQRN